MFGSTKKDQIGLDLKEFIKDTLLSIFDAVQEAGSEIARDHNRRGAIAPVWGHVNNAQSAAQFIEFDVAVTSGLVKADEVRPGIKVLSTFELGGRSSNRSEDSNVSRVKFSVPVVMPSTVVTPV